MLNKKKRKKNLFCDRTIIYVESSEWIIYSLINRMLKVCNLQKNPPDVVWAWDSWEWGLFVNMTDSLLKFSCQWDGELLNKRPISLPALPPDPITLIS